MRKTIAGTLGLILLGLVLAGCTSPRGISAPGQDSSSGDRWAPYRVAMAPSQRDTLDSLPPLPEYHIDVAVNPIDLTVTGQMDLRLPPPVGDVPTEYYFRLYPNLAHYAGSMGVDLVTVNGRGAPFSYEASDTALRVVVPPESAAPGQPVTIGMQWRLQTESWPAERYSLLGASEGVLSLPLFYPVLAVQDASAPNGWRLDVGLVQGDAAFAEAALYQVNATVPANYTVVSTGSTISVGDAPAPTPDPERDADAPPLPAEWKTWQMVSGPAREFALFVSDQFRLAETVANDVHVNSWYLPGNESAGRAAADYTATALRIYSKLFGAYPYAELDVVAGPIEYRGMEYPGLFELGYLLYGKNADELEFRVAHEAAHQWWYNLVGNDAVNAPWLDEGLAEYSTYFYRQFVNGKDVADRLAASRWEAAYEFTKQRGLDAVVNQPVGAFESNYESIVYGKAAVFHYVLQQAVGEDQYLALLRRYAETYRFKVARPEDFLAMAEEMLGPQAREIYDQWIMKTETPPPAPPLGGEGSQEAVSPASPPGGEGSQEAVPPASTSTP